MSTVNPAPRHWPRRILLVVLVAVLLGVAAWAADFIRYRFTHSITRDAFIDSHLVNVAPQVSGDIVEIHVQEQDVVRRGQLLAVIDPSSYLRELEVAQAKLVVAEAALAKAEADLKLLEKEVPQRVRIADRRLDIAREDETKANDALKMTTPDVDEGIAAAEARVAKAEAVLTLAQEDYQRYKDLYEDGSVSERRYQEATRTLGTAKADLNEAKARLVQAKAARQQIDIAKTQVRSSKHAIAEAEAALELAKLGDLQIEASQRLVAERHSAVQEAKRAVARVETTLGYTEVRSPKDGIVAKKWRHKGDYARAGEPIVNVYNPELLYVTANLEETLLEGVAPGNYAALSVDAFDRPFRGRVVWVGSATDAKFSLIPRDVSAGEFTYVVQRVPVRLAFEPDDRRPLLKPGLSVRVAIEHGPGDAGWAKEALEQESQIEGIGGPRP
jgi:membrane fusion protein (multidrug efflux system)